MPFGYWFGRWKWRRQGWGGPVAPVAPVVPQAVVPQGAQPLPQPLLMYPPGSRVRVVAIQGGAGAVSRVYQMGIAPGVELEVVENTPYPWTPILVRVHGMTIALGRGLAAKILAVPVQQGTQTTPPATAPEKQGIPEDQA